ncbi:MAG: hypothetical protein RLZZ455_312 [Candidatus Parcubacteria bacterium]|jgi:uncharacterized membrane protein YjjP (DUF1212 family)
MVRKVLHIEGLAVFLSSVYLYYLLGADWLLFVILFLTPDISMIGYVKNTKIGAITYNFVHNYVLGLVVCMIGLVLGSTLAVSLGLILLAHVGIDRFLGFGLKYPTHFKETHLQKL